MPLSDSLRPAEESVTAKAFSTGSRYLNTRVSSCSPVQRSMFLMCLRTVAILSAARALQCIPCDLPLCVRMQCAHYLEDRLSKGWGNRFWRIAEECGGAEAATVQSALRSLSSGASRDLCDLHPVFTKSSCHAPYTTAELLQALPACLHAAVCRRTLQPIDMQDPSADVSRHSTLAGMLHSTACPSWPVHDQWRPEAVACALCWDKTSDPSLTAIVTQEITEVSTLKLVSISLRQSDLQQDDDVAPSLMKLVLRAAGVNVGVCLNATHGIHADDSAAQHSVSVLQQLSLAAGSQLRSLTVAASTCVHIMRGLSACTGLGQLELHGPSNDAQLAAMLARLTSLTRIKLRQSITSSAAKIIAAIATLPQLKALLVTSAVSAEHFAAVQPMTALEELRIGRCFAGQNAFADALKCWPSLTCLELHFAPHESVGLSATLHHIAQLSALRSLRLIGPRMSIMNGEVLNLQLSALVRLTELTFLGEVPPNAQRALARAFRKLTGLQALSLSDMSGSCNAWLGNSVASMSRLSFLQLRSKLSQQEVEKVAVGLAQIRSLQALRLQGCALQDGSAKALAHALMQQQKLRVVSLDLKPVAFAAFDGEDGTMLSAQAKMHFEVARAWCPHIELWQIALDNTNRNISRYGLW